MVHSMLKGLQRCSCHTMLTSTRFSDNFLFLPMRLANQNVPKALGIILGPVWLKSSPFDKSWLHRYAGSGFLHSKEAFHVLHTTRAGLIPLGNWVCLTFTVAFSNSKTAVINVSGTNVRRIFRKIHLIWFLICHAFTLSINLQSS